MMSIWVGENARVLIQGLLGTKVVFMAQNGGVWD